MNGVTVREMTDDSIRFEAGQRYLLLVVECGGGLAAFPLRFQGAYELGDDGTLRLPGFAVPATNLARDMMQVRTLDALSALLGVE